MATAPAAGSLASNQYGTFTVHYASDAQQKFIRGLAAKRIVPADAPKQMADALAAVAAGTLNKKHASRTIDWLQTLPLKVEPVDAPVEIKRPASDKQTALIRKLTTEKVWVTPGVEVRTGDCAEVDTIDRVLLGEAVESWQASKAIDYLFAAPRVARADARTEEPAAGMYRDGDTVYRVYLGQQSGRMLVKRVVGNKEDGYSYEYVGAATSKLPSSAVPMSLDEAKAWGRMTGFCCVCAAQLDDPESVDRGIGPVCAKKFA